MVPASFDLLSRKLKLGRKLGGDFSASRVGGAKKAILAVANSMLTAVYYLLRDGVEFHDLGPQHFVEQNRTRSTSPNASSDGSATSVSKWRVRPHDLDQRADSNSRPLGVEPPFMTPCSSRRHNDSTICSVPRAR
jgi:hypothetical protein